MAFDLKSATPDVTFAPSTAFLFGADSQSATDPSIYQGSTIFNALLALANTWTAQQTFAPATNKLVAIAAAVGGTANIPSVSNLSGMITLSRASDGALGSGNIFCFSEAAGGINSTLGISASNGIAFYPGASLAFVMSSTTVSVASGATFGFSTDVVLARDAANVLAQRNSTSGQEHRWYNTFTDSSNYERMSLAWSSDVAIMKPQNAGTGSARLFVPVTGATTVAGLPSASTMGAGARSFVTDANATTFNSTVEGGGANTVPVVSNGTNWLIG
jgi:hypothetical protein